MSEVSAFLRYYQLVLIWNKDPSMFHHYCDLLRPVVAPYGGALERMLAPQTIYGDGVIKPDIINVVYYSDRDAFARFSSDPEFRKIVPMRSASIDMMSIEGPAIGGTLTESELAKRTYVVEVAQFAREGAAGYRRYAAEAEDVMREYGYHVERIITAETSSGLPFAPDLVKVAYFDSLDGIERWHRDPAHTRIEKQLYPAAVARSIWVVGQVHPATIAMVAP